MKVTPKVIVAMMGMMLGRPFGIKMCSCKQVVELLSEYFEGELEGRFKQSIDLHVMACSECKNYADSFREAGRLVQSIKYEEIPPEFRSRLREVLKERLQEH